MPFQAPAEPADDPVDLDLFAGPGGWDEGIRPLGVRPLGIEWDEAACATARAAGHLRLQADIAGLSPRGVLTEHFGPGRTLRGLIASPPCQGFSTAGKGRGRDDAALLLEAIPHMPERDVRAELHERMTDDRSVLVLEPLRWALELAPEWMAWEQVPAVLPIWEACAAVLRSVGYSVATGILNAEQHGVPQTRRRAILVARSPQLTARLGRAQLPTPTHSRYYPRTPAKLDRGVAKWVSMAEALGWAPSDVVGFPRRADTADALVLDGVAYRRRDLHPTDRPAPAVTEKVRSWQRWPDGASPAGERPDVADLGFAGAGATSEASVGQIPRGLDDAPAHTITGAGSATWIRMGTNAGATVRHTDEPAPTVHFGHRVNTVDWWEGEPATRAEREGVVLATGTRPNSTVRHESQPAPGLAFGHDPASHVWAPDGTQPAELPAAKAERKVRRVSVAEAAVLQSFPADYPWQGNRTACYRQVGDAVPPLLAQVCVAAVTALALSAGEESTEGVA